MKTDETKNKQAVQIVATNIAKIEANKLMEHGTLGGSKGLTEREGEANSMARYFVTKMYKVSLDSIDNWTDEQKEANELIEQIAASAIAITGK